MAGHMATKLSGRCLVWNRTAETARKHSVEFGSVATSSLSDLREASVVVMCLPTSTEDVVVAEQLASSLNPGACVVSCTSGEPEATRGLAMRLFDSFKVHVLDCPVSGGPRGARAGTLCCMLGSEDEASAERCASVVQSFGKVVHTGPVGSGHAIKAVNNALNCAHLLMGAEGLLALQNFGVDPDVALSVINSSSGRSLQTEVRLPQEVLSRRFNYGFKLPLMAKDAQIAENLLKSNFSGAELLPAVTRLVQQAAATEPPDSDYTRLVATLERKAGTELRKKGGSSS
eukprot:CAMPEP_0194539158 /NCGR_PEP_ID=MMETSP0253-20130528/79016_1 /TAXON_ID=2966 /ORGANISM="Noctiluca scintillans" /LENGTH=286 /DNA_ID=CAMNT_0039385385 /DNA_START=140 /DNA_END=1000 /DNA_ORIENTATION=+